MDLPEIKEVFSKEALRFRYVAEQSLDGSCGYASAATLLGVYWGLPVAENGLIGQWSNVIENANGSTRKLQVSLADIGQMLEDYGFRTIGFKLDWDELIRIIDAYAPIVAHYDRPDKHFALVLGRKADRIVMADSSRGLELLTKPEFLGRWSGFVLVADSRNMTKRQDELDQAVDSAFRREWLIDHLASCWP